MIPPAELEAFLGGYLGETEDHLRASRRQLEILGSAAGQGAARVPAMRELFRALHTIKGLSAMVGVGPVVDLSHAMEEILRHATNHANVLSSPSLRVLEQGLLAIDERVAEVAKRQPASPAPRKLLRDIEALATEGSTAPNSNALVVSDPFIDAQLSESERAQLAEGLAQQQTAMRVDFRPSKQRAEEGVSITSVRQAIERISSLVKVLPLRLDGAEGGRTGLAFALVLLTKAPADEIARCAHCETSEVVVLAEPQAPVIAEADDAAASRMAFASENEASFVRVDIQRLDTVLENLSSLFITRYNLEQQIGNLRAEGIDVRALQLTLQELRRQLRDMRLSVMGARMVSVADVLSRAPLIARGAAAQLGKQVELHIQAGEAMVDKAVGERLLPAIVHLVRNAVDHGIESPDARERAGKPSIGNLEIRAGQEGGSWLWMSVKDDGAGIDVAALARKSGRPEPQSEAELLDLLATPGLSTKASATTHSGRGVGVDAVREIVRKQLQGDLHVSTRSGAGTTFMIKVPVSLAIIDAFSCQSEGQRFAVPVSSVTEIVDILPEALRETPHRGQQRRSTRLLHTNAGTIPILSLSEAIGQARNAGEGQDLDPLLPRKAIIIKRHGAPIGFQVERMLGQQEIVVRPLADPLVQVPGISGATDLGDGRPTLVLDLFTLYDTCAASRVS